MIRDTCELCNNPAHEPRAGYALCAHHCQTVDELYHDCVGDYPVNILTRFQLYEYLIFGDFEDARATFEAYVRFQESTR